mmetsp:Transcript_9466/g.14257  ORF Transcript_9466/g.14257 Transcript_9466/m.14257 type:complete len:400 (-) Transcript_9466:28-1227(-)
MQSEEYNEEGDEFSNSFCEDDGDSMSSDDSSEEDENVTPADQDKTNKYDNQLSKTAIKMGGMSLSYGEAKLYGLIDEEGNIKSKVFHKKTKRDPKQVEQHIAQLATTKPVTTTVTPEDTEDCTFKPQKSKQAERAMKNPRCGYDFVSRLGEAGNFMDRTFNRNDGEKTQKHILNSLKEDYDARLDKLQCPKCRKFQSFDEYMERRRYCGGCQERYTKLHVSKGKTWELKQAENEKKKAERLAKIESELYGDCSFKPKTQGSPRRHGTSNKSVQLSLHERTKRLLESQRREAEERRKKEKEEEELKKIKEREAVYAAQKRAKENHDRSTAPAQSRRQEKSNLSSKRKDQKASTRGLGNSREGHSKRVKEKQRKQEVAYNKTVGNVSDKFNQLLVEFDETV